MPSRERVAALIALVEQGKFVDALEQFYAEDASMQENGQAPRAGLKNLIEHERGVMAAHREIRTRPVESFLVDGDWVVIRWVFEFTRHDGSRFRMDGSRTSAGAATGSSRNASTTTRRSCIYGIDV